MNETILEIADKYLEKREKKSELETQIKDVNKELESLEQELIGLMTDNEIDSFKRNGILYSVVTREFQSANPERKEELYLQMKQKGFEHLFTINTNTLSATVKELIAENDGKLPDWLEGLINQTEKQSIRIKK
ncbi:MAG TPA: hypothetical protein IAC38_00205 [Candidatus Caccovivens faecavium]|nr:hypothetical protein [Candidatus Caccovivens faecavium]